MTGTACRRAPIGLGYVSGELAVVCVRHGTSQDETIVQSQVQAFEFDTLLVGRTTLGEEYSVCGVTHLIETTARNPPLQGGRKRVRLLHYCHCRWQADSPTELYYYQ